MATSGSVDALKLEKWEDAFVKHPVGSVRVMEKQLRVALHEKKEGLRALVGESYRDLLKTAERIVEMNDSIQQVESHLSQASKQCNYGYLQKKAANAVTMNERQDDKDRHSRVAVAEISILSNCPAAISRSLSHDESPLVAAKLYILARLLRRSVSEKIKSPFIISLERQLASLRVTILRHIEQEIYRLDADSNKILQCLGAYALITSSSVSDTFREFQSLRLNAVTNLLQQESVSSDTILEAIRFVNENLRLSTQLFPRRLSDILSQLKIKPIFQEFVITDMMELNLVVHGHWVSDSIRKYTPWLKVDDLSNSDCKSVIAGTLGDALKAIFDGLEKAVKSVSQIENLVRIRKDVISASRAIIRRASDFDDDNLRQALTKTREIVNTRIREVLNGDVDGVGGLGQDLAKLVSNNSSNNVKKGTASWSSMLSSFENAKGGRNLKAMVKVVGYSDKSGLRAIRQRYGGWIESINRNYSHIKKMNEEKEWDPENDDEDDDLDAPESLQEMNDTDTQSLLSTYVEGLQEGYRSLDTNLTKFTAKMDQSVDGIEPLQPTESACLVLRFISTLRSNPPEYQGSSVIDLRWFGKDAKRELHELLSKAVSRKAIRTFSKDISARKWTSNVVFDSLWEGNPKLPVQPSPLIFKFIRTLVQSMNEIGVDIWTGDAADTIKREVRQSVWAELKSSLDTASKTTETSKDEEASDAKGEASPICREQILQAYFDTTYLDNALRTVSSRSSTVEDKSTVSVADVVIAWELVEHVQNQLTIEPDEREKMSRAAEDYWRRTSLLFGVLDI